RTWGKTLTWIHELDVDGFKSGLTPLQATNNLSLAGICHPPSLDEILAFVWRNKALGAYRGLVESNFDVFSFAAVKASLLLIFTHINNSLSSSAKEIFDFDRFPWMFVEHALCKVSRYINRV
ncbi:hypothetical protein K435DRAFT_560851, partial [Dendrothele bispora CBS 962.96]